VDGTFYAPGYEREMGEFGGSEKCLAKKLGTKCGGDTGQ